MSRTATGGVSRLLAVLFPAFILVAAVVAFLPALQNGFVMWDDQMTLTENPNYRGLGWEQLRWMFTTFQMGHYQPLSWMTFGLDYLIWGMNPFGYHLTNIVLHAVNAVVFYFLCVRLLSLSLPAVRGGFAFRVVAVLAALLFSVHPLRVESVAWATERRDVLSGLFILLTLLCYIRSAVAETQQAYRKWLFISLGFYVLSLLSKAVGITVPLVLLAMDVYPLKRLGGGEGKWLGPAVRRVWLEKIPFLLLAAAFAWIAILAQFYAFAVEPLAKRGMTGRISQALYALFFYIWKTLVPFGLLPLYELPVRYDPGDWQYALGGLATVAIAWTLFIFRRQWPAGFAVWFCYAVLILPVSGLVQSGVQLVADRYSYLSCLGWPLLIGAGLLLLWHRGSFRRWAIFGFVFGFIVVAGLGALTWKQTYVWRDSLGLYNYIIARAPESRIAHSNLGTVLLRQNRLDEAIVHFRQAIRIDSRYAHPYINMAIALNAQGKQDQAIATFRELLRANPAAQDLIGPVLVQLGRPGEAIGYYSEEFKVKAASAAARNNLGLAFFMEGDYPKAVEQYQRALEIEPKHAIAYYNMGNALSQLGEIEGAIEQYRRAVQYDPGFAQAHRRLGVLFYAQGRTEEAVKQYRRALEIDPRYAAAYYNMANALLSKNDIAGAIAQYRQAINLDPKHMRAHTNLARALAESGKTREALEHLREAIKIDPDSASAHFNLGLLSERMGDVDAAGRHFRRVIEIDPDDAAAHWRLGSLLSEAGKKDEAEKYFKEALRLQPGLAKDAAVKNRATEKMRLGAD